MAFVAAAPVTSYPSIFGDGSTKNIYSEVFAQIAAQDPANIFQIKVKLSLYNLQQYIKDQINAAEVKGTIKHVEDLDGTFGANFDVTGLGITSAWLGWALDNGENGTTGSAGKVLISTGVYTDPESGLNTTYNNGDTGGENAHLLTAGEIPPLKTANVFGATTGSAFPSIVTLNNSAGTLGSVNVNTGTPTAHENRMPYKAVYRVVKVE
jgi:hypothetical protein